MGRQRFLEISAFAAVFAIYITARSWNLTRSCLWFDEIFSVNAAEHSWNSIFNFVALDLIHPPLFYVLLKLWTAIGGEGLLWLRALPLVFSLIALIPFVLLCRILRVGAWTTVLALLLVAVNGSLIKYSQEVRMYSMLMCVSLFSMWLFARYFKFGKGMVLLVLVNILLVYTHYFGWLVVMSEAAALLLLRRDHRKSAVLLFGSTLVAFLPWLIMVTRAASRGSELGQNIGWMHRPGPTELIQLGFSLVEPFYYAATSGDPMSIYRISVPFLGIAICSIAVLVTQLKTRTDSRVFYLLAIFVSFPAAAAFAASWLLPYSIWGNRHLIIVYIPFAIIVAKSILSLGPKPARFASISLVIALSGYAFLSAAGRPYSSPPWCELDALLAEIGNERADRPIYVFEDLVAYHLWFSLRHEQPATVIKVEDFAGMSEDKAYFLPRGFDEVSKVKFASVRDFQFWMVYRAPEFDTASPPLNSFLANGSGIKQRYIRDTGPEKVIAVFMERPVGH